MIVVLSDLWLPFPGGAERLIFNLARHLQQSGEDVHALTGYAHAQRFDGPPVTIADVGVFDAREQGAAVVRAFIEQMRPDVLIAHHLYASQFRDELLASGVPLVHVVLNGKRIERAALGVFISQWVYERGDARDGDVIVTPPAFDDIVSDTHGDCIGFVKPIEHKGVELFYELAAALPDRKFVVLRHEWQVLEDIRELPNVRFMEPVIDMRTFYAECRLLLMPSLSEDAGTIAQEATLNGLPCISSNVEGLRETNAGGVRLDPRALPMWVAAIERLDDAETYDAVVARQQAHFASTGQQHRLDDFAARVRALRS